ncbi:MAG TPA: ribonuclease III [Casimicrobiaceae bacterium]|nr:ribonuclease III [Casimicrobiaceae bacterium]
MSPAAQSESLGHVFRRPELLRQALTHRSFAAEHNERLEFVGDAVLDCAIGVALYRRFPAMPEGELSRVRANLVNQDTLYRLARGLDLGARLRLGEGEQKSGGAGRPSILADALEAVFGAIFVDGGFVAADAAIVRVYADELAKIDATGAAKDAKTRLQEWLQGRKLPVPDYEVAAVRGEAHLQTFDVVCRIPSLAIAAGGSGPSRRAAEQAAAAEALEQVTRG